MKILYYALAFLPFGSSAQGLHITPGAQWITSGSPSLVLNNASLINNGSFEAGGGTVLFIGDNVASNSFIGGSRPICFYNLTIHKLATDLQLNNDAGINGSITFSSGNLQLNNYTLDLGRSGTIIGERSSACITGTSGGVIKATALLNSPRDVNPGNIGVAFTSDANLGLTVIRRGHVQASNPDGQSGIQRYFDISPEVNSGLQATLRFLYLDGELAGKNKSELTVFSSREGGSDWVSQGKDQSDGVADWVAKNNISELHRFTLAIPKGGASLQKRGALQIFPNPSSGRFRAILISDVPKARVLNLYDQMGHLMESKIIYCQAGVNTIEWNTHNLAAGSYHLVSGELAAAVLEIVR